ncbi:MAG: helix-turn-helix domain-containing protein [Betaproteobacteria bacterium]
MATLDRTANLLGALLGALDDRINEGLAQDQIECASDLAALNLISQNPGVSGRDLRPLLGLSQSSVARLVDRLEAKGLLVRTKVEGDLRQSALAVPGTASRRVSKIVGRRRGILREALGGLSARQVPVMEEMLETLLSELTESRLHAEQICRFCDEGKCPQETCPVELKARAIEHHEQAGAD